MGVAGKHVDCFYLVSTDFKIEDFVGVDAALLYEAVAAHYDEELPFGVVPVLAFGDAWFADVDADLSAVQGVDKFGE